MTIEVEILNDEALTQLKEMEAQEGIRLLMNDNPGSIEETKSKENKPVSIAELYGAIPYNEKEYKEHIKFLQHLRNEWQ